MTNPREQVKRALWFLEREPMPLRDPADEGARRHRIALAVDARVRAAADEKRRQSMRRKIWVLACAAAVALSAGVLWLRVGLRARGDEAGSPVLRLDVQGPVSVVRGGQSLPIAVAADAHISPADELRTTGEAHARAVLANGAVVDVEPSTSLRFDDGRDAPAGVEVLGLERGTIALKVPKLGPRRLSIRTPDATVTVRGTEFRVDVREHDGHSATAVKVVEGSVWVVSNGREITLEKGSEWSSDARGVDVPPPSATEAPPERSEAPPPVASPPAVAAAPGAPSALPGSAAATPVYGPSLAAPIARDDARSTLAAENDQYQKGVSAARAGDDRRALAAFETFLARYRGSPLAQSAEVERFRALKRLGRVEEASRRARQYLAAYPAGFARVEAQSVAVESLSSTSGP